VMNYLGILYGQDALLGHAPPLYHDVGAFGQPPVYYDLGGFGQPVHAPLLPAQAEPAPLLPAQPVLQVLKSQRQGRVLVDGLGHIYQAKCAPKANGDQRWFCSNYRRGCPVKVVARVNDGKVVDHVLSLGVSNCDIRIYVIRDAFIDDFPWNEYRESPP
jgi:hypothetical protein